MSYPPPPPPSSYPSTYWAPPPGPAVGWAIALWIVAGLSLCGALLFGGLSAWGFSTHHHMQEVGVTTTAEVTERDGDDITVEFTNEYDELVTVETFWMPLDVPDVGDSIAITYDPADEAHVIPAGSDEDRVMGIAFAVIAGVGLLVALGTALGAILVHRARSRNLKKSWTSPY